MSDASPRLTSKQRAHLRKLGHTLDPIVRVGKEGLTDSVLDAIDEAFNTHELIKVRTADDPETDAREIAERLSARGAPVHVVQTIGGVMVLYRAFAERPVIELP
ncbi:MAG: ribosome assembly RNA-binding protein YhbY [Bacteroidetes bacterium]|jgi:RNA-binding protein|nr:ribosome assembly RNA-binding protein YhbY [Bacteroidota bacterium]